MGATIYAVPTLVIIMSWLILGQVPRWLAVAGGALCLAGVAVSRSRSRVDQKASAQPAEATPILGADAATATLGGNPCCASHPTPPPTLAPSLTHTTAPTHP